MMKKILYSCLAPLALAAFSLGQTVGTTNRPVRDGSLLDVEAVSAWVQHFDGQGINDQILTARPVMTDGSALTFRATLNIRGHRYGHAGVLIGSAMAPPGTFVTIGGHVSQLFLDLNSVQLVLLESFDFTVPSWGISITRMYPNPRDEGAVSFERSWNFNGPNDPGPDFLPLEYLGLQWYAQAFITSPRGTELSTMAGGVVGNCP